MTKKPDLPLQDKLSKSHALEEVTSRWQLGSGVDLEKQFGWLAEQQAVPAMAPPPAAAPLQQQLEFMLLGWKQSRCMSPLRHSFDRCPGYHILQVRLQAARYLMMPNKHDAGITPPGLP
jgi:hypothetical protein